MFDVLVAAEHPGSQAELLRSFALPIALMQDTDALTRITTELVEDKAADRVHYMEIKWAPAIHRALGLSLDEVVATVASAASQAAKRLDVVVRLTVVGLRSDDVASNIEVAEVGARHRAAGVTGFDLAGFEGLHPDPSAQLAAFDAARAGGLGITVHSGEVPDPALVRGALTVKPSRIAHGAPAIDDPSLIAELIARGITLDLCPTSNVQAGTVSTFADHPLARLVRQGVGITINTDDTTISNVSLSEEMLSCHVELGLSLAEIWRCNLHALHAAFVEDDVRAALLDSFRTWAAFVPELHETSSN